MTEEEKLIGQFGKENPFRVPEGYFDNFASSLMEKLPELSEDETKEKEAHETTKVVEIGFLQRMRKYAAAIVVLLVVGSGALYMMSGQEEETSVQAKVEHVSTEQMDEEYTIDQIADYAMLDNEDFYAYTASY